MDNYNQDNINEIPNNSDNYNSKPEYSFWAENTGVSNGYNYYHQYRPQPEVIKPKKKGVSKFFLFVFRALIFGILVGVAFAGVQFAYYKIFPDAFSNNNSYILGLVEDDVKSDVRLKVRSTERGTVSSVPETTVMKVAEMTMPSIVSISSTSTQTDIWFGIEYPSEGSGSGIIIGKDEDELFIATNNHVVSGTDKITVTFIDDSQADAVIKGTDTVADLAVITVKLDDLDKSTRDSIAIAKLGNSDDVEVGEMAIAIGNAMGYGQSVTVGYVSAKDRKVEVSDNYSYKTMVLLQTDAAINPGNSGGALINIDGEVIGINTVKFASYQVEGMGYAIPISRANPIINDLMNREVLKPEEKGFLGIGVTDVTDDVSERFGIPMGVYVSSIVEGSAADKAGLNVGDVIQYVNDTEISSSVQLTELISSIRVGTEIEIKYMRHVDGDYKEHTVYAKLGSRDIVEE